MSGEPKERKIHVSPLTAPAIESTLDSTTAFKEWLNKNITSLNEAQKEKLSSLGIGVLGKAAFDTEDIGKIQDALGISVASDPDLDKTSPLPVPSPATPPPAPTGRKKAGVVPASVSAATSTHPASTPTPTLTGTPTSPDAIPSALSPERIAEIDSTITKIEQQKLAYTAAMKEVGAGELKGKWKQVLSPNDATTFQSYFLSLGRVKRKGELLAGAGPVGVDKGYQSFREMSDALLWYGDHVLYALREYKDVNTPPIEDKMKKLNDALSPKSDPSVPLDPLDPVIPPLPSDDDILKPGVLADIERKNAHRESEKKYKEIINSKRVRFTSGLRRFGIDPFGVDKKVTEAKSERDHAANVYYSVLHTKLLARAEKQKQAWTNKKTGEVVSSTRARSAEIAYDGKGSDKLEQTLIANIDSGYRLLVVERIKNVARKRIEEQRSILSEKAKNRLLTVTEHMKRNKWKYRAGAVGAAALVTGGAAALAGAGLMTVLTTGGIAGGIKASRMALSMGAAAGAGAATYAGESLVVRRREKSLKKNETGLTSLDYSEIISGMNALVDDYEKDARSVVNAIKARRRNTLISAGVTGFVVGGLSAEVTPDLLDRIHFLGADNDPSNINPPGYTSEQPTTLRSENIEGLDIPEISHSPNMNEAPSQPVSSDAESLPQVQHPDYLRQRIDANQPVETLPSVEEVTGENYVDKHIAANQAEVLDLGPEVSSVSPGEGFGSPEMGEVGIVPESESAVERTVADSLAGVERAGAAPEIVNLVPNPEQYVTIPDGGKIDTLSEAFYQKYCDGELVGLPDGMSQSEFVNKMDAAFHGLDNNPAIMERMKLPNTWSIGGDVDKVLPGQEINVTPLIEYMNGRSIEEIELGQYHPDDALARAGETLRVTTVLESPRPLARPETLVTDEVPVSVIRPLERPEGLVSEQAVSESPRPEARPADLTATEHAPTESPRPIARPGADVSEVASVNAAAAPISEVVQTVAGNFEVLAGNSFAEVFGEGVQIPESYKLALQTELNEWANENNVSSAAERSEYLVAMMARDVVMMKSFDTLPNSLPTDIPVSVETYDQWKDTVGTTIERFLERLVTQSNVGILENSAGLPAGAIMQFDTTPGSSVSEIIMRFVQSDGVVVENGEIIFPNQQ